MKNRVQNNKGFTLIELILVVAIIGVLSSVAVMSSINMYSSYKLRGAARQVYSDMQYVRLFAIKQGKETVIDFEKDGSGDVYYMLKFKSGGKLPKHYEPIYLTGDKAAYKGMKACHPTDPSSAFDDAEFNPNGTAAAGGIKLSMGGKIYRVYVSSTGTGNVRILNIADLEEQFPADADECP